MIKNIWFDMGGVIFIQDTPNAIARFQEAGLRDTDHYMSAHGQKDFLYDVETGAIDEAEFCRRMSAVVGHEVSYQEAMECWTAFIRDVPADRLAVLERLRKHYRLGLLTNTNPFVMAFMQQPQYGNRYGIGHYFDDLFCSYKLKCYKPGSEIFLKSLAQSGVKAEETLFVDDNKANVEAAIALGFHGMHVPTNRPWEQALTEFLEKHSRG